MAGIGERKHEVNGEGEVRDPSGDVQPKRIKMNKSDDSRIQQITYRVYATFSPSRGTSRTIQDGERSVALLLRDGSYVGNRWRAWLDYCKRRCFEDCIREIGGQRSLRSLRKMRDEGGTL